MNRLIIILFFAVSVSCLSCKKYLNVVPDDIATLDMAFDNRNDALNYLYTCYSHMQSIDHPHTNPGLTSSGEIIDNLIGSGDTYYGSSARNWQYLRGSQTVDNPMENNYGSFYQAIRKCNTFLENVNKPVDLSVYEKARWISEIYFLKAYYYFSLVRQYGPVPLIKQNLPISTPTDQARIPRAPSDSIFSYIIQLCESAVNLPPSISVVNEYGRATSVMALALKAKALVYQASPLFNGEPNQARLKAPDGTQLFPATADPNKWAKAAAACKAAIDAAQANGAKLYYSSPTIIVPAAIQQQFSIQDPITGPQSLQIPENIWPGNVAMNTQASLIPNINRGGGLAEGTTQLAVPLGMAELFYTNNGVGINEDNTWNYTGRYNITTAPNNQATKYYVKPSYSTINLHMNREPRFYADLSFDGGIWYGDGIQDTTKLLYQSSYVNGSGTAAPNDNNLTGYWPKKLAPYTSVNNSSTSSFTNYYPPLMRLSDLYLLYAEALNEASGPSQQAYNYIDSIRLRAGLQGVVNSYALYSTNPSKPLSKDGLRAIIHQERRIELCFEGDTGWDLRRWLEYMPMFASRPVQGWSAFSVTSNAQQYFNLITAFVPYLSLKDYFWPISTTDLLNNDKLVQNIGW